jgi:superfamily II DNA or RNA helicase
MELGQILNEKGIKTGVFTSKVKIKNRVEIVKDINNGNTKVLVATINLLSEGANIPILSCLHLVTPSNNIELERQKIGRIRRVVEGKKSPVVRDYVDEKNEFLSNMAKSRKKHYKKLNFNVIEVKC